jgi:hypothetical protein
LVSLEQEHIQRSGWKAVAGIHGTMGDELVIV